MSDRSGAGQGSQGGAIEFRATVNRKLPNGSQEPTGIQMETTVNAKDGNVHVAGDTARQNLNAVLGQEFTCGELSPISR